MPGSRGRVRAAVAREIHEARGRGIPVTSATTTLCYLLADQLDRIERDGEDRYLIPQLVARLLEERRAAALIPSPVETADDVWSALARDLAGTVGDTPQP